MRKTKFENGEVYHIFNRGVDKREVFLSDSDYFRFLKSMKEFNNTLPAWKMQSLSIRGETSSDPYIEIIAYCFNPNHFHLLVKQLNENGVSEFMRKLGTGYTMYFNKKHDHSGVIFQGVFKSVHVDTNEYFLYVSAYVNCNSEIHNIEKADKYKWCSFPDYMGNRSVNLLGKSLTKDIIFNQFRNVREYCEFAKINASEMKKRKEMEKFCLE